MFSTRQSVASDGTPFLSMPIFRNRPRLILPKSIMSTRPTRPDAPANTIRIGISRSQWRTFPLFDLQKSGIEDTKFICYLCKKVKCRLIGHGQVVWMFHNYSLFLFKFTKNPPLDPIYILLIWLTIRYLTYFGLYI